MKKSVEADISHIDCYISFVKGYFNISATFMQRMKFKRTLLSQFIRKILKGI